jgi:hypothetical protein
MMAYLSTYRRENDMVYVYYGAVPAFLYYSAFYGLADVPFVQGSYNRQNINGYFRELSRMSGRSRVWILFSHDYNWTAVDEETLILEHLDQIGRRLDQLNAPGSQLYLYDLSIFGPR